MVHILEGLAASVSRTDGGSTLLRNISNHLQNCSHIPYLDTACDISQFNMNC